MKTWPVDEELWPTDVRTAPLCHKIISIVFLRVKLSRRSPGKKNHIALYIKRMPVTGWAGNEQGGLTLIRMPPMVRLQSHVYVMAPKRTETVKYRGQYTSGKKRRGRK